MKVVFELIKTFEFEVLSVNGEIKGKVELFQNLENSEHFRFNTLVADIFRLTPLFSQNGEELIRESDETIWTETTFPGNSNMTKEFMAKNLSEATQIVLSKIEAFYQHILL